VDIWGKVRVGDGEVVMVAAEGSCADEWAAWNEADERHTRALARRNAGRVNNCADGLVPWCENSFGKKDCACVDRGWVRDQLMEIDRQNRRLGRRWEN